MKALIAVDQGAESRDAVTFASRLLSDDDEILFVNVVGFRVTPVATVGPAGIGAYGDPAMPIEWVDPSAEASAEQVVQESSRDFDDAESRVEHGDVATRICETATSEAVDLVILGTHDRGLWSRLWFGSVSAQVVRDAPCPVLVVR